MLLYMVVTLHTKKQCECVTSIIQKRNRKLAQGKVHCKTKRLVALKGEEEKAHYKVERLAAWREKGKRKIKTFGTVGPAISDSQKTECITK